MTTRMKGLALAVVATIGIVGGLWWLNHRQPVVTEPAIVEARQQSAVAAAETKPVADQLAARIDTVTRWLTRVDTVTVPERVLHPTTPTDTAAAVSALPKVEARYQSCRLELGTLLSDCDAFRVKALARFRADSITMHRQQTALDARRVPSRWSVGLCALYGIIRQPNGTLSTGEAAGVCGSYRIW